MGRLMVVVVIGATACGTSNSSYSRVGQIALQQNSSTAGAIVGFTDDDSVFGSLVGKDGSCSAYSGTPATLFSAGTLQVAGTTMPITFTPSGTAPDVKYSSSGQLPDPLFATGATITATAAGSSTMGDLPGFTISATAPQPISGVSLPAALSRSAGATVSWDPLPGARIWILMVAFDPSNVQGGTYVLCDISDAGSYTIPGSTMALLPATDSQGLMLVGRLGSSAKVVSDTRVELDVISAAVGTTTIGS